MLLEGLDKMINISRRRYYEGYEIALCERVDLKWNIGHICVPSAPNPDKYERIEFIRVYERMCVTGWFPDLDLYDEWVARSRLR